MFGAHARKLAELGFSVIPIKKGHKKPDLISWKSFQTELPGEEIFSEWEDKKRDCGIGVCLGEVSRVIAVDIDLNDKFLLELIPKSIVTRIGRKGEVRFFQNNPKLETRRVKIPDTKNTVVELLCQGTQVLVCPSIHPETNIPYKWQALGLDGIEISDLPTLPDNFNKLLDIVESRYRNRVVDKETFLSRPADGHTDNNLTTGGRHDTLLGICFAAVNANETDNVITEKLVAYDNKHHKIPWFQDPGEKQTPQGLIDSCRKTTGIANPNILVLPNVDKILQEDDAELIAFSKENTIEEDEISENLIKPQKLPTPAGGLIRLIFDAVRSFDPSDPEEFALSGAHALTALFFARKFRIFRRRKDGDLLKFMNIWPHSYSLNIAASGVGKSYLPKLLDALEEYAPSLTDENKFSKSLSGFSTSQAISAKLSKHPVVFAKEEEASIMFNKIADGQKDLADVLCDAWTSAAGKLQAGETKKELSKNIETISRNPALILMAFTTETNFATSCTHDLFKTGLMARFRCYSQDNPLSAREKIAAAKNSKAYPEEKYKVLGELIEVILDQISEVTLADINNRYMRDGEVIDLRGQTETLYPHEVILPEELAQGLCTEYEAESIILMEDLGKDHPCTPFVNRATEHILSIALEHRLGRYDWQPGETARRFGRITKTSPPVWCGGDNEAAVELEESDLRYGYQMYKYCLHQQYVRVKTVRYQDKDINAEELIIKELSAAHYKGKKLGEIARKSHGRMSSKDKRSALFHLTQEDLVSAFKLSNKTIFVISKHAAGFKERNRSAIWITDWRGQK